MGSIFSAIFGLIDTVIIYAVSTLILCAIYLLWLIIPLAIVLPMEWSANRRHRAALDAADRINPLDHDRRSRAQQTARSQHLAAHSRICRVGLAALVVSILLTASIVSNWSKIARVVSRNLYSHDE